MRESGCRLTAADLGCVDAVGDHHDGLAHVEEPVELDLAGNRAWIRQFHLDLVQFLEPLVILRARDGQHHERLANLCGPE